MIQPVTLLFQDGLIEPCRLYNERKCFLLKKFPVTRKLILPPEIKGYFSDRCMVNLFSAGVVSTPFCYIRNKCPIRFKEFAGILFGLWQGIIPEIEVAVNQTMVACGIQRPAQLLLVPVKIEVPVLNITAPAPQSVVEPARIFPAL